MILIRAAGNATVLTVETGGWLETAPSIYEPGTALSIYEPGSHGQLTGSLLGKIILSESQARELKRNLP